MSGKKEFKTLEEQIDILRSKGLIINNVDKAKSILLRENYFFINGYRYIFLKSVTNKTFLPGTTFEELYALFTFDRCIRNIMFKNILIVENNIKSIISYQLSKKYGIKEKDYLKSSNFTKDYSKSRQVIDILNKMKRQIRVNVKQHSATLHYITNYGYIPLWIMVKVLSFGIISDLYSILKDDDKLAIARYYDTDIENLEIFLMVLSNYRNLCAHEDILYSHQTQKNILDNKYHRLLNIPMTDNEYIYGKNDLFSTILIMKHMLSNEEFRLLAYEIGYEIDILDGKVDVIPLQLILDKIGFPPNWREIVNL
ncbi:MAG: Abi family protein [Bacilli bacterium]|nr:Abi family protein [Bacilli bacterium]